MKCVKCNNEETFVRIKDGVCLNCIINDLEERIESLEKYQHTH